VIAPNPNMKKIITQKNIKFAEQRDNMENTMRKVTEASYLTADLAAQYRTILRYFYLQHERMRDFITPEEILMYLRSIPAFINYEEEQLQQLLAQLVKWNNLHAMQDMTNAKTIEEYKKKRFRYQPTAYTIEIERMLVELEKKVDNTFQGSLDRSQFDRLLLALTKLSTSLEQQIAPEEAMRIWEDVLQYFKLIRTSTADYIAYINSEKTDQRMQTDAFLIYKNQFTNYLRDFIVSLQKTSIQIIDILHNLPLSKLTPFFNVLVIYQKNIPRLEEIIVAEEQWILEYEEYWGTIQRWFIGTASQNSELDVLQWQTNEMIRRITRYVQRIGERQHHFKSRKNDYLHLSKWFSNCETLSDAHELSSIVFGAMSTQHLQVEDYTTDNLYTDTWDEAPIQVIIKPRTSHYREKTKAQAMRMNTERKHQQQKLYLEERKREQQLLQQYMKSNRIQLSEVGEVEPFIRKLLLGWIAKARSNKEGKVKTDYGMTVKIILSTSKMINLQATDGILSMPDVIFEFEKE